MSTVRDGARSCVALVLLTWLAAGAAGAATISLTSITNSSTCVTANGDDGNDDEDPYNPANAACSEPLGGSDSNFMRLTNTGLTSSSASAGSSTSVGFNIDAGVGVDSAVDGQDEYERGKVRYTLSFSVTATLLEDWTVDLAQNVLGLYGFAGDGPATAVGTQVFGNAGISTIDVDVNTTDYSFTAAPNSGTSNVANTGTSSVSFSGSRNSSAIASGTGNASFSVTISFDIDAFSDAGCTGFICSSASGGEDAAVLLGYDNVDDCCGGTVDRINADNYSTWGRAVAPDGYNSTWTLNVTTTCGNGVLDNVQEFCDEGANNGQPSSCCTTACVFKTAGTPCRPVAGVCDVAESCDGFDGVCPADQFSTSICRSASGVCDQDEVCGGGPNCPSDAVQPNGTPCRIGSGDSCDPTETCNGVAKTCPADVVSGTGTLCRAGSGDACDLNETCSGTPGIACPADDAPGKAGVTCRTGSGDSCDVTETCTGTPGATCPADDAPSQAGVTCRAGSGDACDVTETCSGSPGATCPADDAPGKAGVTCRAGSGDSCDVTETCTGTPGAACPADDAPGNAGTVCNPGSGDACDPDETCSGTPGAVCPADTVTPMGTECRVAAGICDVAETCSGTADAACPVDGFVDDGTSCTDGAYCNGEETCQAGACADHADPCAAFCDENTDTCSGSCPATPMTGCRTAGSSLLLVKDKEANPSDRLLWKWSKGQATAASELGQPLTTTNYALCVYAGSSAALLDATVAADGQRWKTLASKGYKYKDPSGGQQGIQKILMKTSATADASKMLWKGAGELLPDFAPGTLPIPSEGFPVLVQILNDKSAVCFESTFGEGDVKRNRADMLKLKH